MDQTKLKILEDHPAFAVIPTGKPPLLLFLNMENKKNSLSEIWKGGRVLLLLYNKSINHIL